MQQRIHQSLRVFQVFDNAAVLGSGPPTTTAIQRAGLLCPSCYNVDGRSTQNIGSGGYLRECSRVPGISLSATKRPSVSGSHQQRNEHAGMTRKKLGVGVIVPKLFLTGARTFLDWVPVNGNKNLLMPTVLASQ